MNRILGANTGDLAQLNVKPTQSGLPGGITATGFVTGIAFYGLLLTIVGVVLSAGLWAVGSFSGNYTQTINGKKGFLVSFAAAFAIGGGYLLVGYFFTKGQNIDIPAVP